MDDAADDFRSRLLMLEEVVRALYRSGALTDDMLSDVDLRLSIEADEAGGEKTAEAYAVAAQMARMLPIEASQSATAASDMRADFRRQQMRERTALINQPDGGNDTP